MLIPLLKNTKQTDDNYSDNLYNTYIWKSMPYHVITFDKYERLYRSEKSTLLFLNFKPPPF